MSELIYDTDEAVDFIATTLRLDKKDVSEVLAAQHRYLEGLGIVPPDDDEPKRPLADRACWPEYFPKENMDRRFVDTRLELLFVIEVTVLDAGLVGFVLTANETFMAQKGIIDEVSS